MQSSRGDALAEQCPESVQQELRVLYTSLGELARHFWACFPPTSPQLEEKAAKMYETMKKFQQVKEKQDVCCHPSRLFVHNLWRHERLHQAKFLTRDGLVFFFFSSNSVLLKTNWLATTQP